LLFGLGTSDRRAGGNGRLSVGAEGTRPTFWRIDVEKDKMPQVNNDRLSGRNARNRHNAGRRQRLAGAALPVGAFCNHEKPFCGARFGLLRCARKNY